MMTSRTVPNIYTIRLLHDLEECEQGIKYERRTPLTHGKALNDLGNTKASVWGPSSLIIEDASEAIARLAKLPVR